MNIKQKIIEAVEQNDARKVHYFHNAKDFIETSKLTVRLIQTNIESNNNNLINSLKIKLHFLKQELDEYENSSN